MAETRNLTITLEAVTPVLSGYGHSHLRMRRA